MRAPLLLLALLLVRPAAADVFDDFLAADLPVADGFDLPVGDAEGRGPYVGPDGRRHQGWYVATRFGERYALGLHPGEDWNGRGGGNTDLGQPVNAIGAGRVVVAGDFPDPWGKIVVLEHLYYENNEKRRLRSLYAHLSRIDVKVGEAVARRATIGAIGRDPGERYPAHLHLELRTDPSLPPTYWPSSEGRDLAWIRERYVDPRAFIAARRRLFVPQDEAVLLLVHHAGYRMALFEKGARQATYEIGLGQGRGQKRVRGDLKTPKGMYFVVEKHRGEFPPPYGPFYGGHWIKIGYPNPWDAEAGREAGLITVAQQAAIAEAWARRALPSQKTRLGGGIGLHGWAGEWEAPKEGAHLSWGCLVMHNPDITSLYARVPRGAMVVLF